MAALFITEAEVRQVLTMERAIEVTREIFRRVAMTEVSNISRARARTDHAMLHLMGSAAKTLDAIVTKTYTSSKEGTRFLVNYYHGRTGELLAVIEADALGTIRTGAVSAIATDLMANHDANTVGVLGSGKQARTQLEGVCEVRDIVEAYVYSPSPAHREDFAHVMEAQLGIKVVPVSKPELAVEDKDIVITATTSLTPVFSADWLRGGVHINAIGSNFIGRVELEPEVVRQCDPIVVDDKEQARLEAGDLVRAVDDGVCRWSDISQLSDLVVERTPGRHQPDDITLFKSVGSAFEDLAVAKAVYERAFRDGLGQRLPF